MPVVNNHYIFKSYIILVFANVSTFSVQLLKLAKCG